VQNILTGIYTSYNSDATLKAALPGGLHFEMAPQGTSMTYAVFNGITSRSEYMFSGEGEYEYVTIQIDVFADTNAKRTAASAAIDTLYQDAKLTISGYTTLFYHRAGQPLYVRDGAQNEIFRSIFEFKGAFQKGA
jgi:hypothetical protein